MLWLTMILWLGGCTQSTLSHPEPVTITIAGSTAMAPVLRELTAAFSRQHPNVVFNLRGGGSTLGEQWAAAGQVDLAASTLQASIAGPGAGRTRLVRVPIGVDAMAIVVHDGSELERLTVLQLRDLFSGRVLDWEELGGPTLPVLLVSREDGSGTRHFFEERVMGGERVALTAIVMPTSQDVLDYVGTHPAAIGYLSASYLSAGLRAGTAPNQAVQGPTVPQVQAVALEEQWPTIENLRLQRYHLAYPIYLVTRGEARGWVRQFVDFVLSPAGQELVGRLHGRVR